MHSVKTKPLAVLTATGTRICGLTQSMKMFHALLSDEGVNL